jgi:hypothetical protein
MKQNLIARFLMATILHKEVINNFINKEGCNEQFSV